jgi:cold shock CspA family protein
VLVNALAANSNSHELHYAYAKLILASDNPNLEELKYHLRHSFTPGDTNYEAQLLYGRQLFLSGQLEESKNVFRDLERVRMSPENKNRIGYHDNRVFQGAVSKLEFSYLWVRRDGTADYIFAHRNNIDEKVWVQLKRDARVNFRIGLNMKGPSVYEISL